jgi:hypothetical protein
MILWKHKLLRTRGSISVEENGKILRNVSPLSRLDYWGLLGWELVTATYDQTARETTYVLRLPIGQAEHPSPEALEGA